MLVPAAAFTGGHGQQRQQGRRRPSARRWTTSRPPRPRRLLASDGSLLAYFYEENRQDVPLDKISADHAGRAPLDRGQPLLRARRARPQGHAARARQQRLRTGQTQGGSSITQQLVKLTLVQQATHQGAGRGGHRSSRSPARSASSSWRSQYEKDAHEGRDPRALPQHRLLRRRRLRHQAAANHFFSVSPDKLDVRQAATLAGLVKNPVEFDPTRSTRSARCSGATLCSRVMAEHGKICPAEGRTTSWPSRSASRSPSFPNGCVTSKAAFSCDYVRRYLLAEPALGSHRRRTVAPGSSAVA